MFTHTPSVSPSSATISGTPGFNDAGIYTITWSVSDGHGGNATASTGLTVNNTNRPPTLTQPSNMTVNEGTSQDQVLSGTDPDGDNLTFALVSGPSYVVVTQLTPTTANARVAPGFNDSGTATGRLERSKVLQHHREQRGSSGGACLAQQHDRDGGSHGRPGLHGVGSGW